MQRVKLGDVAIEYKANIKSNLDKLPSVGLEHIDSEDINLTKWSEGKENTFTKVFKKGHILFGRRRSYLKKAAIAPFDGICSGDITVIEAKKDRILPELLPFIIQNDTLFAFAESMSAGSLSPRVKWEYLKNFEFDLPELEEQEKLAELLWAANDAKEAYKRLLSSTDDLIKSKFIEMFGDSSEIVILTDYVWFQEGPGVRSIDFTESGTILLTGSNINDNQISLGLNSDRFISDNLSSGKYRHFMCDANDILAVTSAIEPAKFDKKVVVVQEDNKYCLNTGIIRFKPNKEYLTLCYFREFLKSDFFKSQVMTNMHGIAQMHFGPSHLKQMKLLLPKSLSIQKKFSEFIDQSDESTLVLQQAITDLEKTAKLLANKYIG